MDKLILAFTDEERRVVAAARQRYLHTLTIIAELHGIEGSIDVAPDLTGFIQTGPMPTKV